MVQLGLFHHQRDWPPFFYEIMAWMWPTQIFLVMLGDSAPIAFAPREHILSIILWWFLALAGNVILYALAGFALYSVYAWKCVSKSK